MYQNFVFDLYGTLVDVRTTEESCDTMKKLAKFYAYRGADYTIQELRQEFRRLVQAQEQELCGKISEKTGEIITVPEIDVVKVYRQLFAGRGIEVSVKEAAMTANWHRITATKKLKVYPGVTELFEYLKQQGKRIYLLSNAQREYTAGELQCTGLADWFDGILLSSDYQCRKPDPAFFHALFDMAGISPDNSLMIGNDRRSDIGGAAAAGMDSLLLATDAGLAAETDGIESTYEVMDGDFRKIKGIIEHCGRL